MTLYVPRAPIAVDPLIAEAKQRARRRRFNVACVLAAGALLALGLSLPARSGVFEPKAGAPSAAASVTSLNADGYVGPLRLDHSSAADIRRFAGAPEFDGTGSFATTLAGYPATYLALGYGCSATLASAGRDPGGDRPAHLYCHTVYYLSPRTHALAAVWTDSPAFRTSEGTRPGMNEQTALRLERSEITGIIRTAGAANLALGAPCTTWVANTPHTSSSCGRDRVSALALESRIHPVGLLFE